jgi:hypothetical protein
MSRTLDAVAVALGVLVASAVPAGAIAHHLSPEQRGAARGADGA